VTTRNVRIGKGSLVEAVEVTTTDDGALRITVDRVALPTAALALTRSATNKHDIPLGPVVTLREKICVTFIHLHPSLSHGSKPSLCSQNFRLQPLFQRQNLNDFGLTPVTSVPLVTFAVVRLYTRSFRTALTVEITNCTKTDVVGVTFPTGATSHHVPDYTNILQLLALFRSLESAAGAA